MIRFQFAKDGLPRILRALSEIVQGTIPVWEPHQEAGSDSYRIDSSNDWWVRVEDGELKLTYRDDRPESNLVEAVATILEYRCPVKRIREEKTK